MSNSEKRKFTRKEALKRGIAQKQGLNMSPQAARIARQRNIVQAAARLGFDTEFHDATYYALCLGILAGKWDTEDIKHRLVQELGDEGFCIKQIIQTLTAADILKYYATEDLDGQRVWVEGFRETFLEEVETTISLGIENAPAKMLPLKNIQDWAPGVDNLNHRFISHSTRKVLDAIPESVLGAANKLQGVKYTLNLHLYNHLHERQRDLNRKGTVTPIEQTQLDLQIMLLKQLMEDQMAVQFMITSDYRGRFYYRGGLITPQGHDFCKAAFQYKKAVKLGKHGKEHLAIHYANVAGKDKLSIQERLIWAYTEGTDLAIKVATERYFPAEADKPYQTLVAAYDWFSLMQHEAAGNKARKYKSRLVCHIDGSCNGLQHGAALLRCSKTAEVVNCLASTELDKPEDAYRTASEVASKVADKLEMPWMGDIFRKYGRKAFKQAVMTTTYGSQQQVKTVLKELEPAEAKEVLTNDQTTQVFTQAVLIGVQAVAGSVMQLDRALQSAVKQKMAQGTQALFWRTSDGFPVMQAKKSDEVEGFGEFTYRSKDIDPQGQKQAITANMIHSIDADHLRAVIHAADFPMTTVHDSYGCHAGNMQELHRLTREKFEYIHQYDYIGSLQGLSKMLVVLPDAGDYDITEVRKARYFFS